MRTSGISLNLASKQFLRSVAKDSCEAADATITCTRTRRTYCCADSAPEKHWHAHRVASAMRKPAAPRFRDTEWPGNDASTSG